MTTSLTAASHQKHDVHKFHDVKPKLGRDNWTIWKRELLATARDWGLYATIIGTDIAPTTTAMMVLTNEWNNRNNSSYNQILLCISPELQTTIDDTDVANEAWKTLIKKFESMDPSKISIIWTKYKNYHMVEGQSIASYLTTMWDFRNQLKKMGEVVADSTHAATVLRNVNLGDRSPRQSEW